MYNTQYKTALRPGAAPGRRCGDGLLEPASSSGGVRVYYLYIHTYIHVYIYIYTY